MEDDDLCVFDAVSGMLYLDGSLLGTVPAQCFLGSSPHHAVDTVDPRSRIVDPRPRCALDGCTPTNALRAVEAGVWHHGQQEYHRGVMRRNAA